MTSRAAAVYTLAPRLALMRWARHAYKARPDRMDALMPTADTLPLLAPPFRRATAGDAQTLAEFVEFASEGLALYLWSKMANGGDPWEIGRERILSAASPIHYGSAIIAEKDGQPAAGLISYSADGKTGPVSPDLPGLLVPLQVLLNQAADTWYVHVLAAYPRFRGKGQGAQLLALADRLAAAAGKTALSLIVSDTNAGARRLYEQCGYREIAKRPMIKEAWQHPGVDWLLLRKTL
jgi:ribosomal protein S18 acetylase RimI-like enzyme